MTEDEVKKAEQVLKEVADSPVSTYLYGNELDAIVADGRFKSLNEVANTEGFTVASDAYLQGRSDLEQGLWGIPADAPGPIYGFMETNVGGHIPQTEMYGDVKITLKDSVAERTTFTVGDSLNSTLIPARVSDARNRNLSPSAIQGSVVSYKVETFYQQHKFNEPTSVGYFEAQVHGGIKVTDIKTVTIDWRARVKQETLDNLKANGIEVIQKVDY